LDELEDFHLYDPWKQDYRGRSGYCVLALRLSLWGVYWSFSDSHPKDLPEWLPEWIFKKHQFETIMWIVSIGADADTNGATAGPLLAAYHTTIPENLLEGLKLRKEIEQIFKDFQNKST